MVEKWLTRRITVEQAEAEHAVRDDELGPDPVPFGFIHQSWTKLLAQMEPGDELWEYSSPPQSWANLAGRAGIALVRRGEVVASLLTTMN